MIYSGIRRLPSLISHGARFLTERAHGTRISNPSFESNGTEFLTEESGMNIQEVIDLCQHLHKQANYRMSTSKLNDAIEQIVKL